MFLNIIFNIEALFLIVTLVDGHVRYVRYVREKGMKKMAKNKLVYTNIYLYKF